jgi:L-seryl-tRNA(Ser) seleniumtransferase
MAGVLGNLPSVSELLESPPLKSLVHRVNRSMVVSRARRFLDDMRTQVQSATAGVHVPAPSEIAQKIADWIATDHAAIVVPVINATGIILHAELGGPPLAEEGVQAMVVAARGFVNVEMDLSTGQRCAPEAAVEDLLMRLTGAEAATVVNSTAAATLIALAALAGGREVIVARGQVIETTEGFRLPQIAMASGAVLRDVGTANKTPISDYEAAIGQHTAALMRIHASDFSLVGSTRHSSLAEVVALGRRHNLTVIDDIGGGSIIDVSRYGVIGEPTAGESIRAGADLVLLSGNRLLGGPECGIIIGRKALVESISAHPRFRAVRVDKYRLSALAATLRLYQDPDLAERSIPVLTLLSTPVENLRQRAERLAPQISATGVANVEIIAAETFISQARLPQQALATICLVLTPRDSSAEQLATNLRTGTPSVVGRIDDGRLLLDLRSIPPGEDIRLVSAFEAQRPSPAVQASGE